MTAATTQFSRCITRLPFVVCKISLAMIDITALAAVASMLESGNNSTGIDLIP